MAESKNTNPIRTLNKMGSMFFDKDPAYTAFLEHIEQTRGYFADIGSAYGYSTLEALKRGGRLIAVDLEKRHLDVLLQDCPTLYKPRLETICGHFPNNVELPKNSLDGILLSRVLIFLTPDEIASAFTKAYDALNSGGLVYIVTSSPLLKKWSSLSPLYDKQKLEGSLWPGRIENLWELVPEEAAILPNTIQLIDTESLEKGLTQAGFKVKSCDYYPKDRPNDEEAFAWTYAIAMK
ncbi:MAG: class I SAM-dependent methyltransferase [Alphaproteobacteria bacterium]|nr:class I SAM-dependent methyltransferase [Alphaproteobacteria bacterium]